MSGPARLVRLPDVYLDTSVLLGAMMPGSTNADACEDFCAQIASQGRRVYYSQTVYVELSQALRKMATRADRVASGMREQFGLDRWEPDIHIRQRWMQYGVEQFDQLRERFIDAFELPFDRSIWLQSIDLMVEYFLQAHDAVHAATARAYGLRAFATTDADFVRVTGLDVILLRDAAV